jgi:hypothetical protein
MARAIDGELLELEIANIANKLAKSDAQKALMGRVMYCVEHMPTLTPPNEPLTLKELREMDDEPVWCCPKNDSAKGSWMIVGPNGCENITSFAIYDDYGTGWLAYRRPPEVSP